MENNIQTLASKHSPDTATESPRPSQASQESPIQRLFEASYSNSSSQRADRANRSGAAEKDDPIGATFQAKDTAKERDSRDQTQSRDVARPSGEAYSASNNDEPAAITKFREKYEKAPRDTRPEVEPPAPAPRPDNPPAPDPRPEPEPRPPEPGPRPEPGPKPGPNPEAERVVDSVKGVSDEDKQRAKSLNRFEELVIKHINEERKKHGLGEVKFDPRLQLIALHQSKYQERTGACGHFQNTPGWRTPMDRMKQVGLPGDSGLNENAAFGWKNPGENASEDALDKEAKSLVAGWKSSPGHYKNILAKNVTMIGLSHVGRASTMTMA